MSVRTSPRYDFLPAFVMSQVSKMPAKPFASRLPSRLNWSGPASNAPLSSSASLALQSGTLIPRPAPAGYSSKATLVALRNDLNRLGTSVKTVDCTLPSNRAGAKRMLGAQTEAQTRRARWTHGVSGLRVDITAFLLASCNS